MTGIWAYMYQAMGIGVFIDAAVFVVFHHADDRHLILSIVGSNAVTQRVLIGKEALGKLLIDDADVGRGRGIGIGKVAAGKYGDSEGTEEVGPGHIAADRRRRTVCHLGQLAVDRHGAVVRPPTIRDALP